MTPFALARPPARPGLATSRRLRRLWLLLACVIGPLSLGAPSGASAAEVACPNSNPIVNENNCMGPGTTANQLSNYSESIGGFTTQTSYQLGQDIQLKIGTSAPSFPATSVNIAIYRIGWYGGAGARLIPAASAANVTVNNRLQCNPMNATTGELSCANWNVTYTILGSTLPVSGIYEAVFTDLADGAIQNYVIFTVRNDERASHVLFVLPVATYEAYNTWGCKSLYFDACGGTNTIAGDGRAVAVSFDRPLAEGESQRNKFFGPDVAMVRWLEQQGYDVTYTDDIQTDQGPSTLLDHQIILISGHSEYWSAASFNNMLAAREAGVSIASFSANTAYWQTRYADSHRSLIDYKTVQGTSASGGVTPNDPASLGPDGIPLTADDEPLLATTTRRDPGAPAGDPNAPPGGRIGPNLPENRLFGVLYVGDSEQKVWGLTIPAGNYREEFAANRVWRNTGISTINQTTVDTNLVGWEWDQIPSASSPVYSGAAAVEPPGVKQLTLTNTTDPSSTWIQDAGRLRAITPPEGQPGNVSATEYRTGGGAYVFAAGTIQWAYGLDTDRVIDQATYNILSEMGAQPATPASDITLDSPNAPKPPWAAFTATPSTIYVGQSIKFDASASSAPEGAITEYRWDLDGSGKFATSTGSTTTFTHTFTQPGTYEVSLRVLASNGQQDVTTRTVIVRNPVSAGLRTSPNPTSIGKTVELNASGSTDAAGSITDYRWDLDGSGKYATDTGSTPIATTSFQSAGPQSVGVQVTDQAGYTARATVTINVVAIGVSSYSDGVLATPGLLHYYRLGEAAGPAIADSKGSANGTLTGATFGVMGAINGDPDTAVSFPGTSSFGAIPMDLSSQTLITVEFWLKWNQYGNNNALALELTPNFNEYQGGFLIDPNAPEYGGTFGVGIGRGASRNAVYFKRPTAGVWHYYAFVLNSAAPAGSEITPFVDGQPVAFQQGSSGTGAGPFANSTLYLNSRAGSTLFGAGSLDELAIYGGALTPSRIQEHDYNNGIDPRPKAAFTMSPSPARVGETVTFDASQSSYSKGTVQRYEWDLNGDGTYETVTTVPKVTTSYGSAQTVNVGLRVVDSNGGWDYTAQALGVGNYPPVARASASPNPALTGQSVTLDASKSTDQGTITDYRWDLNGDGVYETDTGTTPTVTTSYQTMGVHTVGAQATDNLGLVGTTTVPVKALERGVIDYPDAVQGSGGLLHYYRLGESSGPTIADSKGSANGGISGGTFGLEGALAGDPNTAIGFNGTSDFGTTALNLSGLSQLTIEFWLKWNKYANNNALAMEFTPNFNEYSGGFLVDPNAPEFGGTFAVGIGRFGTRNAISFKRPSAGVWHHYVFVLNGAAPASSEITPYVDGQPVGFQQGSTGTGATFTNSTLYLMSRAGTTLFGAGTLDELAIYSQALSPATVFQHYNSYGSHRPPTASFTVSPNPGRPEETVTLDASGSSGAEAPIADYQWDLNGDGNYETDTGTNPKLTISVPTTGTRQIGLRVIDSANTATTITRTVWTTIAPYGELVLNTPGLTDYYRLGESAGPTIADSKGSANGTVTGGAFGLEGAIAGDPNTAIGFDGTSGFGAIPLDLSKTSQVTVEFWLKWNKYANNNALTMELTPNFNEYPGGFLIDPNAPEFNGTFGVGIGRGASRNAVYFQRPSPGVWHYYAFVLNGAAPATSEIAPYVDGKPVSFQVGSAGTGAGSFAKATLFLMSRSGTSLFGAGTLDELAIYSQPLGAATIEAHYKTGAL